MALLKYFKIEKRGSLLPDPSGSLNQYLSSSAIEEANKEVTAVLDDPAKRHPYLKITFEQKAIIARYAVNHRIVNAVRQFPKDFPQNSLRESTIRRWKKTYLKELSSRKKADSQNTTGKEKCAEASRLQTAIVFPLECFDVYGMRWLIYLLQRIKTGGLLYEHTAKPNH